MHSGACTKLGYEDSPNFLRVSGLEGRPFAGLDHAYRKARDECGLHGIYLLRDERRQAETPVVFYCRAEDEQAANEIHRKVWNQGVVPFVLVETPRCLRLYSGFRCNPKGATDRERGVLAAAVSFLEASDRLDALRPQGIDSGAVWEHWGADSQGRVDWALLAELERLGKELRGRGLERRHAHALVGRFVYLRYLRDRGILSDSKLARWGLAGRDLFGQRAQLAAFWELNDRLDGWLNGSVFPLDRTALRVEHLQLVASVFMGGSAGGQLALDLGLYDFSFIPIEMLSVIYQQFLHAPGEAETSKGREKGTYYTPLPLVNYVLAELEGKRPLVEGMRVLDPSCGSGAFLVQCYRTLAERRLRRGPVTPAELSALLTEHIFGVERDGDACRVAEMSLVLALLDYVDPPDLEPHPEFRLPTLHDTNVFEADFFDPNSPWATRRDSFRADWLVGNPPWVEAKASKADDRLAFEWMRANSERFPTGGNQLAEAFVWHSLPLLDAAGVAGLLLPAMTLFKMESTRFRARLFQSVRAWCVANFANLAYVLFAGRAEAPAVALFYAPRDPDPPEETGDERIFTFAPMLANQRAGRPGRSGRRKDTWSVVVDSAEAREIRASTAQTGDFLPWKEAMWGSPLDGRLLRRVAGRFPTLGELADEHGLNLSQGIELRSGDSREAIDPVPEIAGERQVDFSTLRGCGRIFAFPEHALSRIPPDLANVRKGRGDLPLSVSRPPHVILDEGRRFAVFGDSFLAVPPRQIGISGEKGNGDLLKAIGLYLGSDFCRYHQFLCTPRWGVSHSVATLASLKAIPVPLVLLDDSALAEWANLHDGLVARYGSAPPPDEVLREIDGKTYNLLGLTATERILVEDFVAWNMQMVKGKVPSALVAVPTDAAMRAYLALLRDELDAFVGSESGLRHEIHAVRGGGSAMLAVQLRVQAAPEPPTLVRGTEGTAAVLAATRDRLVRRHSQWLYFERSLKIYEEGTMYVLKPLEAIHWTRRHAILDAGEIVAETLGAAKA